jgi:hypothetical protein
MRTPSHRVESGGNNTTKPGANKPGRVIPDGTAEWVVSGARKGLKKKKSQNFWRNKYTNTKRKEMLVKQKILETQHREPRRAARILRQLRKKNEVTITNTSSQREV